MILLIYIFRWHDIKEEGICDPMEKIWVKKELYKWISCFFRIFWILFWFFRIHLIARDPWIRIGVMFLNKLNSLISNLNSSSDLIEFQRYLKNFLISPWIRPLLTITPFNSWMNIKIDKFELCFDTRLCVFNNRTSLFRQQPPSLFLRGSHLSYVYSYTKSMVSIKAHVHGPPSPFH